MRLIPRSPVRRRTSSAVPPVSLALRSSATSVMRLPVPRLVPRNAEKNRSSQLPTRAANGPRTESELRTDQGVSICTPSTVPPSLEP